tara:strand:+ start:239 stop:715 length:477 start_codon:yes stop_codon:yes gene_type:complete
MKFYEATYIVHSALQEGRLNDIIESVNSFVKSAGGEILYSDNWGRKKLSYMIEKQKYGTYVFFQFKVSDASKIQSLNIEFDHNPNILRALVVSIDETDIFVKNNEVEDNKSAQDVKNTEIEKVQNEKKEDKELENSGKDKNSDNSDKSTDSENEDKEE